MLEIKDLTVRVEDKKILDNFSINIGKGEVHAIMGPNGTGKSTLSKVILGSDEYKNMLPKRCIYGHKGSYGRAFIIAGSVGLSGAAFITTECTVRAGAGLTTLVCPKEIQDILSSKLIEAMTINLEDNSVRMNIKNADSITISFRIRNKLYALLSDGL